ncbi:rhodanese-like domain-containing protein [Solemya velesiana gill symbiont]|uniref:rhodanese-like domain-containing protein n=1 Tax=Solemya velesiana gill symbiont TaxID=1918948 RepID=UPI001FE27F54|nr:rhodanese-like domain-containing protein [Solemya velesiana gill symbiont]
MLYIAFFTLPLAVHAADDEHPVNLTADHPYVDIEIDGKSLRIERTQDTENMVDLDFALTSRACPPFCIQPIKLSEGVETIGELELIDYIKRLADGDESVVIIDSRTGEWLSKGMIPGAINIPWSTLNVEMASPREVSEILELQLGATFDEGLWNFDKAKTLVLYCNGPWCGQSPTSIRTLLSIGYPTHKLKWYRMGMPGWMMLGLTTVTPEE